MRRASHLRSLDWPPFARVFLLVDDKRALQRLFVVAREGAELGRHRRGISGAISKTINMPNEATVEQTGTIGLVIDCDALAWSRRTYEIPEP
jgi:hypothetical protein